MAAILCGQNPSLRIHLMGRDVGLHSTISIAKVDKKPLLPIQAKVGYVNHGRWEVGGRGHTVKYKTYTGALYQMITNCCNVLDKGNCIYFFVSCHFVSEILYVRTFKKRKKKKKKKPPKDQKPGCFQKIVGFQPQNIPRLAFPESARAVVGSLCRNGQVLGFGQNECNVKRAR